METTNRHFYKLTAPSPRTVAQQQYLKRKLEKKGVDTSNKIEVQQGLNSMGYKNDLNMVKEICGVRGQSSKNEDGDTRAVNHCTPEDIAKYVDQLQARQTLLDFNTSAKDKLAKKSEH